MEAYREGRVAIGAVLFARNPVADWVTPIFQLTPTREFNASIKKPRIGDAWLIDGGHDLLEEKRACALCGERFKRDQWAIWVSTGPLRSVVATHLGCAINENEVILSPDLETESNSRGGVSSGN